MSQIRRQIAQVVEHDINIALHNIFIDMEKRDSPHIIFELSRSLIPKI